MARPQKENASYFSHDADMRNDTKIKAVRRKFGHLGYSIWSMLLEALTNSNQFVLEWDELNIELLAGDFDVDSGKLVEIISYFERLKMIEIKNKTIFCKKLVDRFQPLISKRKRNRKRVMDNHNAVTGIVTDAESTQRKGKEIKGNKSKTNETSFFKKEEEGEIEKTATGKKVKNYSSSSKEKKTNIFVIPTIENVIAECTRVSKETGKNFSYHQIVTEANKIFAYYKNLNWKHKDSGNTVTSWNVVCKSWLKEVNPEKEERKDQYNGSVTDITPIATLDDDLPF